MSIETRPATGRDSVPLPPSPWTPGGISKWCRDRDAAEAVETASEARERTSQEMRELGLHDLYRGIFDKLVGEFEKTAATEEYRGLSLDECNIVSQYGIEELLRTWRAASKAMSKLDRDRFEKFAADAAARLAEIVAQFGDGKASKVEA
jgi:hypothetical protein